MKFEIQIEESQKLERIVNSQEAIHSYCYIKIFEIKKDEEIEERWRYWRYGEYTQMNMH